jgi:hypothetical protein
VDGEKSSLFEQSEIKWGDGEPSANGDCVFLNLKNSTENSLVTVGNCADKKKFICEVSLWLLKRRLESGTHKNQSLIDEERGGSRADCPN